jgi:hypothetical protein
LSNILATIGLKKPAEAATAGFGKRGREHEDDQASHCNASIAALTARAMNEVIVSCVPCTLSDWNRLVLAHPLVPVSAKGSVTTSSAPVPDAVN